MGLCTVRPLQGDSLTEGTKGSCGHGDTGIQPHCPWGAREV